MELSIRQRRKMERANKRDKNGFSMSLSRRQRRALRRNVVARSYKSAKGGVITLEIGGIADTDNFGCTAHRVYGGGSMKYN